MAASESVLRTLIQEQLRTYPLEELTAGKVRRSIEQSLGVPPGSLKEPVARLLGEAIEQHAASTSGGPPPEKRARRQHDGEQPRPADGGGVYWELGTEKKRVQVHSFRGSVLVDIRAYYNADDGAIKPTRKGVSLTPPQWARLVALAPAIQRALEAQAGKQGDEKDDDGDGEEAAAQ